MPPLTLAIFSLISAKFRQRPFGRLSYPISGSAVSETHGEATQDQESKASALRAKAKKKWNLG
jgi:hypothetical protein